METNSNADDPISEETADVGPTQPTLSDEPPEAPVETATSAYSETPPAFTDDQTAREVEPRAPGDADEPIAARSGDSLQEIAVRAQAGRLSAAEEERGANLIKEALLAGKAAVTDVIEVLPQLPWIVGVNGVGAAWPEMKPAAKTLLIKNLSENQSDAARRLRLSLARGLFKQDAPIALKIAAGVAKEMWDKESGVIAPKSAQIFSNVFIGKAKPWVSQLPLAELKPGEGDALVHCALLTVFTLPHPPVAQLGVIKWAAEAARLSKLQEPALGAVLKGISRWSAKWQAALRRETKELPEVFANALRSAPAEADADSSPQGVSTTAADEQALDLAAQTGEPPDDLSEAETPAEPKPRPVYEPRPQKPAPPSETARESRRDRPIYQPRNTPATPADFNLSDTLRQIEAHVVSLRAELNASQAKLRQKEDDPRKGRRSQEKPGIIIEGDRSAEELAQLNLQLEGRIAELQHRIQDLLADAEDRAASLTPQTGEGAANSDHQLRALLGLKLQENFADFRALEKESPSVVVQQHYKSLLRNVFEVLQKEGVPLKE